jgi:hypothetical protein
MLNLYKQSGQEIIDLKEDELDLVTGGGRIADGILLGAIRAGLFVPMKCQDGYTPVRTKA